MAMHQIGVKDCHQCTLTEFPRQTLDVDFSKYMYVLCNVLCESKNLPSFYINMPTNFRTLVWCAWIAHWFVCQTTAICQIPSVLNSYDNARRPCTSMACKFHFLSELYGRKILGVGLTSP